MWAPISSTNTRRPGSRPPISTRHPSLKNSSRSAAPLELFSAPRETSYRPAHRGFTHPHPHDGEQELGPLSVGGPRPLLQVFREQLPRLPVQLGGLAGGLPRFQGAALVELLAVTLDRCPVNAETAGGLALGDALLHRLDDLLSEVHRVRSHAPVLPGAASSHSAVGLTGELRGLDLEYHPDGHPSKASTSLRRRLRDPGARSDLPTAVQK